jgi:hypothetical protein
MGFRPTRWRFDALRVFVRRTSRLGRSRARAPPALSRPFRDMLLQPRTAASLRRPEGRATAPQCFLSWALAPYDTFPGRWIH